MARFIQGEHRKQQLLFPPSIDEYVDEDNIVRVIDEYVDLLDMETLSFSHTALNDAEGRPAYHPKLLLKIYIYGYLNGIRSSRKIEREIDRNVEMMWLCSGLKPRYKTIANFRKENPEALKKVFKEFVLLTRELNLITGELVAIDGAFLRANASKNQLISQKTLLKDTKAIDQSIEAYLSSLTFADNTEAKQGATKPPLVEKDPLFKKQVRKARLKEALAFLEENNLTQYNKTDPDAKLMVKPAHNLMAYNVQIAVDDSFKFIVATDTSSVGNDTNQLHTMATQAKEITQNDAMVAVADAGYYNVIQIKQCQENNLEVVVPVPNRNKAKKEKGVFTKEDFVYDKERDYYLCPNHQILKRTPTPQKRQNRVNYTYRSTNSHCKVCPLRDKCLPEKTSYKSIYRWEHEDVIEHHHQKMQTPEAKKLISKRGAIVEHPFGTTKRTLGWDHFLVRGREKVSGENALVMFVYNFRRMFNLIGAQLFRKLILAIKSSLSHHIFTLLALFYGKNGGLLP